MDAVKLNISTNTNLLREQNLYLKQLIRYQQQHRKIIQNQIVGIQMVQEFVLNKMKDLLEQQKRDQVLLIRLHECVRNLVKQVLCAIENNKTK